MNREDIIRLAEEAGLEPRLWNHTDAFERFAALVAEHERERILEMCREGWWDGEGIRYHLEQQDATRGRA